ncbi:MAG: ATP-binding cassette domain-containing protein [Actinomycetaceae bacterium]|nr:ATP-binding cassette domain-containing protein [Actinomycetaceae bacterium]
METQREPERTYRSGENSSTASSFPPAVLAPINKNTDGFVKLLNLQRTFDGNGVPIPALRRISTTFPQHRMSAIIGPEGAGKSTLLACIAGIESVSSGHILVDSRPISALGRNDREGLRGRVIGYVSHHDHLVPSLDIADNIVFYADMTNTEIDRDRFRSLVRDFGLTDVLNEHPPALSLQQRLDVSIVRELLLDPPLLLVDEPGTDPSLPSLQRLMRFLAGDNRVTGRTIIYATSHASLSTFAENVFFMSEGDIVAQMNTPTPGAVAEAMKLLSAWDPAVAFKPVRRFMSQSEQKIFFPSDESPRQDLSVSSSSNNSTKPSGADVAKEPNSSLPQKGAGTWPLMSEALRERLHELRIATPPRDIDTQVSPQNATEPTINQPPKPAQQNITQPPQSIAPLPTQPSFGYSNNRSPSHQPFGFDLAQLAALIPSAGSVMPEDLDALDAALQRELNAQPDFTDPTSTTHAPRFIELPSSSDRTNSPSSPPPPPQQKAPSATTPPTADPSHTKPSLPYKEDIIDHPSDMASEEPTHLSNTVSDAQSAYADDSPSTNKHTHSSHHTASKDSEDVIVEGASMKSINEQIVRMKARLRAMAEQAERRLNTLDAARGHSMFEGKHYAGSYNVHTDSLGTAPVPLAKKNPSERNSGQFTDSDSERLEEFRKTDDKRWSHLMSIWAIKGIVPEQASTTSQSPLSSKDTETKASLHQYDNGIDNSAKTEEIPRPVSKRLQLIELMQKANELLIESDEELKKARLELGTDPQHP